MNDDITSRYMTYHNILLGSALEQYKLAETAKITGLDPSDTPEPIFVTDLSDRVAKLLSIPIAERLREILSETRNEQAALIIAPEIASGKYPINEMQTSYEAAVRIGVAIITDGITVAPIEGISAVRIKKNSNGSEYLSVEFAGPMRSAGGTESALTLVIADCVRKTLCLDRYIPNSYEDEIGRFIEELRVYERDVGNFQYKVSDQDIVTAINNIPVEIDGVATDDYEVIVHRNMKRIRTNKVRGGALRVINDGVIGKSKKLLALLNQFGVSDWNWLSELSGGKQQGTDETKASFSHFDEVISGRPVLSAPHSPGGFRLRYGRAINTGIHAVGIHPGLSTLLAYPVVAGTQIKVDIPGKAASVAFVDTIDGPIVRLKNGAIVHVKDAQYASSISAEVESIIHVGDLLISYGDFLENNTKLLPSGYVEEWWVQDLRKAINEKFSSMTEAANRLDMSPERIAALLESYHRTFPSLQEALRMSQILHIPMHPKYLLFWDQVSPQNILELRTFVKSAKEALQKIDDPSVAISLSGKVKPVLEALGLDYYPLGTEEVTISGVNAHILLVSLGLLDEEAKDDIREGWSNSIELVSKLSGIEIRAKSSAFIGVRVGRPEKASERKMKPPVEGLFPMGKSNSLSRDILAAAEKNPEPVLQTVNLECPECSMLLSGSRCPNCDVPSRLFGTCQKCNRKELDMTKSRCVACGSPIRPWSAKKYNLAQNIKSASARVNYQPQKPLRGVFSLSSELKVPEAIEKALLRQKHDLSVYRDGTIRYDITNVPLTHFRPRQIQTTVEKLKKMGYATDIHGQALEGDDQLLELMAQDVVLPDEAGIFLVSVAKFVDDLLQYYYKARPFYNVATPEDLIGQLIIGLAPHTSVGIVGRIIGYTNAQACFAHPYWHSAKRRDCDGDGDSVVLLMDAILNFSKKFLPSIIGGMMDAPLLIQPVITPKEVQRQAHHMDVCSIYPTSFYEATQRMAPPGEISDEMDILRNRIETTKQYENFGFTHDTTSITVRQSRSSYSTLSTLDEKLDRQIEIAEKIRAVDPDEVVKSVLKTHILPDIVGNIKAYTSQKFRCKNCGTKYRRIPVRGDCLECGGELRPSVTRAAVEKYLQLGLRLARKYDVGDYLRSRLVLAVEELATLFKPESHQANIKDYLATSPASEERALPEKTYEPSKAGEMAGLLMTDSHGEQSKRRQTKQKEERLQQFQTTLG